MAIDCYLAMTAAEIASAPSLPQKLGYMACHFSPYSTGLSNFPQLLPPGAMLLLTDRTPIRGHDPELIGSQLSALIKADRCSSLLLDFQRGGCEETAQLVRHLTKVLPCPVAVSDTYGAELDCPVLLPPSPPDTPLADHLAPWKGREIWLELALDGLCITVTSGGSHFSPAPSDGSPLPFRDARLHCHYRTDISPDQAVFTLRRTPEDLASLLEEAEELGAALAVGLYQELGMFRI